MKIRAARQWLRCYRPSGADAETREFQDARAATDALPDDREKFLNQLSFDQRLAERIHLAPPPELESQLASYGEKFSELKSTPRLTATDPAILMVGFAFLVIVGIFLWMWLASMETFDGIDEVRGMAALGDTSQVEDFEPVEAPIGALGDWFVLQGLEDFKVPSGVENLDAVGVRVLPYEGKNIAMVAVPEKRTFFYVFQATGLGVQVDPKGRWHISEYGTESDPRTMAVLQNGNQVAMLTFAGTRDKMEQFIKEIEAR